MTFTLLGDHSQWGTGKTHIQSDAEGISATLCGKHLGFDFEAIYDGRRYLHGLSQEEVLSYEQEYGLCKNCKKVFLK